MITEPVQLRYPPDLPEQMFELTQCHPVLLQKLCREVVDIANADLRRDMTQQDLDKAVKATLDRENLVFSVFRGSVLCVMLFLVTMHQRRHFMGWTPQRPHYLFFILNNL